MPDIEVLFLDLDDTLYPPGNGIWQAISDRINSFMIERLKSSPPQAEALRAEYLRRYGTSLTGLMLHEEIDPADYLSYVHDIDIESFLSPDHELAESLAALPQPKHIFTNASRAHARRVLRALAIDDHVQAIVAIEDLEYVNKPAPDAFHRARRAVGSPGSEACLLVDDRLENLRAAGRLGWQTAWVGPTAVGPDVDFTAAAINPLLHELSSSINHRAANG